MNKKLRIIFSSILISFVPLAYGTLISPEIALQRIKGGAEKASFRFSTGETSPSLLYTANCEGEPTVYLFNSDGSTLCLAADDEIVPVLGYSDSIIDINNLPPAFKAWMESVSNEISSVRRGNGIGMKDERTEEFPILLPMCDTKWSQDAPYNDLCPLESVSDRRCYTGCAATSMAQVMKYHNWPETGEGSISYFWNNEHLTLTADFSLEPFNWNDMLDVYEEGEYSEAEGMSVAYLMKSCGYSIQMSYTTSGSGAIAPRIGEALGRYFKYDKSKLRYVMREYFTLDEWEKMIYSSLESCGPVILNGQSNQGGHSFVCDGYGRNGYFHINWGWGGVSDGYFLLSALDPYDQGIGGSGDNSGFNFMQDAVIGITPAKDLDRNGADSWIGQLYSRGELGLSTDQIYSPGEETYDLCEDGVYNYGPAELPADMIFGLLFRSEETGECYINPAEVGEPVGLLYGFSSFSLPLPGDMPDGKYKMTLSYYSPSYAEYKGSKNAKIGPGTPNESSDDNRVDETYEWPTDNWIDVLYPVGIPASYTAYVDKGQIRFETPENDLSEVKEVGNIVKESVPEKYYNLQGIEIGSPLPGEIVVVKRGRQVLKIRF